MPVDLALNRLKLVSERINFTLQLVRLLLKLRYVLDDHVDVQIPKTIEFLLDRGDVHVDRGQTLVELLLKPRQVPVELGLDLLNRVWSFTRRGDQNHHLPQQ